MLVFKIGNIKIRSKMSKIIKTQSGFIPLLIMLLLVLLTVIVVVFMRVYKAQG